jgi:hypothetical protein
MGEVILNTVPETKEGGGEEPLQYKSSGCKIMYCYSCKQRIPGGEGGENPKAGLMLAYLFTDCALDSDCHYVFSYGIIA